MRPDVKIEIRDCAVSDLETLRDLALRTFDDAFRRWSDPADFDQYLEQSFNTAQLETELRNPLSRFFFLHADGKLVGYLKTNVGKAQTDLRSDTSLEIERIYVTRGHQGGGLGRALVEQAFALARQMGKRMVWLGVWEKNTNAIAFYERIGFRKAGTHHFMVGSDRQTDFIMTIELS